MQRVKMAQKDPFWKRFINLITFINLPIRQKFTLFGVGILFWFLVVGFLAVAALSFVHFRYSQISSVVIPYMNAVHQIGPKMQENLTLIRQPNPDFSQIQGNLYEMDRVISKTLLQQANPEKNLNIFELFNYILAKKDTKGSELLSELTQEIQAAREVLETKHTIDAEALLHVNSALSGFMDHAEVMHAAYSEQMNSTIRLSINTIAATIFLVFVLQLLFTRWLTQAFAKPIGQITEQIQSISTGDVDLGKKMRVHSKDEIGVLSREFNTLVDTIYGVTVFKKVIEEDTSLGIVYTRLAEVFEKDAGIKECRIFDVNDAKNEMYLVEPALGGTECMVCNPEILHDACLCRAKKTGHPISSLEFEGVCRQFTQDGQHAHVCIPLVVGGRASGVVQFLFDKAEEDITQRLFKAENYIKHSLSVIETKQLMQTLRESALIDGLTGLYNRRFLQDHSSQIISGVLRRQKQISLLMCDMDYFKQVNDEYGHDVGDSLLKETSRILQSSIRESDVVIRFGGEEFLILLVDVESGEGMEVAEKIRQKVEETNFKLPTGVLKKTISMGVAEFPNDTDGFWHAIKFADVALYRAKEEGRNRCVRFSEEMWQKGGF
jgi:diguanylate cyclase (GGDEF)-like protein